MSGLHEGSCFILLGCLGGAQHESTMILRCMAAPLLVANDMPIEQDYPCRLGEDGNVVAQRGPLPSEQIHAIAGCCMAAHTSISLELSRRPTALSKKGFFFVALATSC